MALPEERRERLKALIAKVVDEVVLNEEDALAIIQICLDACEREKAIAYEEMLKGMIEDGTDAGPQ
jgi:predicted transcriptional regulator